MREKTISNASIILKISNLNCASCISKIKSILEKLNFISEIDVNLLTSNTAISFSAFDLDDLNLKKKQIISILTNSNFQIKLENE